MALVDLEAAPARSSSLSPWQWPVSELRQLAPLILGGFSLEKAYQNRPEGCSGLDKTNAQMHKDQLSLAILFGEGRSARPFMPFKLGQTPIATSMLISPLIREDAICKWVDFVFGAGNGASGQDIASPAIEINGFIFLVLVTWLAQDFS